MGCSGCAVKVKSREDFAGRERNQVSGWQRYNMEGVVEIETGKYKTKLRDKLTCRLFAR